MLPFHYHLITEIDADPKRFFAHVCYVPVCTRSPTSSLDIVTDFPFSRCTLAIAGKE